MKLSMLPLIVLTLVAAPAFTADKRVEEAVARAETQLEKGKPEEALKNMQKMASQVNSAEAYAALGRIQMRAAGIEEAAASLTKALELAGSAPPEVKAEVLATLSGIDLSRGSGRDAVAHAQEAVNLTATPITLAALARAQVRAADPTVALQTADKAVAAGASSADAHDARGMAILALARGAEAEAAFRKALELSPKLALARVHLAQALMAQGKAAEAEAEARKATEADPRSAEAFAVHGRAILALDPKRWGEAIAQAQQGAFVNPRSAPAQVDVGRIFEAADNLDQAGMAYRKALESDPSYGPARAALVGIQLRKGQLDAAHIEAEKLAQEMPNDAGVQLQLGRILLRKGDFAGAVPALEKARDLAPGMAETHARLGTAYQYMRRTPEALTEYTKAVEQDPRNLEYRTTYGLLLGLSDKEEAGIEELKKVIASPGYKDYAAYVNLGWLYRNMEPPKADESVAAYRKALELNPKEAQAALGLGWAYSSLRKFDDSITSFNKAVELDTKTTPEANHGIAWSYFFKNDLPKSREFMEKAKAAGRNDQGLRANIERRERGETAAAADAERAMREAAKRRDEGPNPLEILARGRDAGARGRACREAVRMGADSAVPALIRVLRDDPVIGVRIACAQALGGLGGAAKQAIPHLTHILSSQPPVGVDDTKEQMLAAAQWEDLRRAARDALQKIR